MDGLWINVAGLEPLDVVLTSGSTKLARTIRASSNARFTHAVVSLGGPDIVEADGLGTLVSKLDVRFLKTIDGRDFHLAPLPGDPNDAMVLRHPDVAVHGAASDQFRTLISTYLRYAGSPYSRLERLARLQTAGTKPRRLATMAVARLLDAIRLARRRTHYPFCSELVAILYEDQGPPLFVDHRHPSTVTPDQLSDSDLIAIPGLLLSPTEVKSVVGGYLPSHSMIPWHIYWSRDRFRRMLAWDARLHRWLKRFTR